MRCCRQPYALLYLVAFRGLRRAEVAGQSRQDTDLTEAGTITIRETLAAGADIWVDSGRVFTRADGRPLRPQWISTRFDDLGGPLPPIRFHDLRHGAATLALLGKVRMKLISETPVALAPLVHR
ncbi:hypothetical protein [Actinomadura sp. K4S16]|uniref:hypothetical protein n=1 Tax=Actinomadura sp. K4S16 TaxID=1316147 RepID=UPI0011ED1C03|nr:hypothetical protein [Actinomadura sp. K4S16]